MDNLCHTLVGAALAETALRGRTAMATGTLVIGANLPDIDVLAIPFGHGIDFRRGHTHGVIALIVLPFVLAGIMRLWYRRRGRKLDEPPFDFGWTAVLAAIAILTHPFLDWMNTYGVRWLMPFDGTWYSAESLFILDPVLWIVLGFGVWASRTKRRKQRRDRTRPATLALGVSAAYIAAMMATSWWTRVSVTRQLAQERATPDKLVVSPRPVSVAGRNIIHERDGFYRFGRALLLGDPPLTVIPDSVRVNRDHTAARAAMQTPEGRKFMTWSRMPFFVIDSGGRVATVRMDDARYSRGAPSFAAVQVEVPLSPR